MPADPAADSARRLAAIPAEVRHAHLVGVGGTAMAALAQMLAARGIRVTGSDQQLYEPTASLLAGSRIEVKLGHRAANLEPAPDLAVVGNVIVRTNPEAEALARSRIPFVSMPEALWHFFLRERRVLMIAGTHGKTTSTAMMAHILERAGRDPSTLVGGVAKDFASNYRIGNGRDFVIEGDEYDTAYFDKRPKFIHYHAQGAVITAVEFDHADIYRDLDHVKSSFRELAAQMDSGRVMAVCADFPAAIEITMGTRARCISYGLEAGDWRATGVRIASDGAHFSMARGASEAIRELHLPIGGRMNVANALGVAVLLREFGLSDDEIRGGLASFRGVIRRQEVIGEAAGVTVIDDFAHHPTAIRATLEAIAERYAGRRILAAFEPRSNTSRRNVFQADFAAAFDRAGLVFLGPVFFKDNDPIPPAERLATDVLAHAIASRGPRAVACASNDQVLASMLDEARAGDIAVFMSNGPFDNLKQRFVAGLRGR